ncbi:MAG: translation initiation factor IF-2 [Lentisphaeria bacterium]|nr:translation initiation factor IF-2 [Lentisphaeria bacterium]
MASKNIRIRDWATQYGLQNKEVIAALDSFGFPDKTAASNLPQEAVERLVKHFKLKTAQAEKPAPAKTEPAKAAAPAQPKPAPAPVQPKPQAQAQPKPAPAPVQPKPQVQAQPKTQQQSHVLGGNAAKFSSDIDDTDDSNSRRERFNHPGGGKSFRHDNRDNNRGGRDNRGGHDNRDRNGGRNGRDFRDNRDNRDRNNNNGRRPEPQQPAQSAPAPGGAGREVHIKTPIVVKALADAIGRKPNEVIMSLMMMNVLASINQTVESDVAQKLAEKFGCKLVVDHRDKDLHMLKNEVGETVDPEDRVYSCSESELKERPPIVTFMGHVDHGKTSLQDCIRKTHVTASEAGGITQSIGASVVNLDGKTITFVDTPGHEAFTQMRARGANVTDIVVLVVAADDGFMPQTIEALNHARAAKVPIIVAVNKMDLPDANFDRVLRNMQEHELMPEDWGGQVAAIKVSARTGSGIDDLLERILLEAEMLELKANPKNPAQAFVLESELEQGLGATANVVVKNGTLRVGDAIICGQYYGKVKSLIDSRGHRVPLAGPSTPVKVVGLSGVPEAGTRLAVCESLAAAKSLGEAREADNRIETLSAKPMAAGLEALFSQMEEGKRNDLKVVVKADVRGSTEAIVESLKKKSSPKISIEVIHSDVGAITENDVMLASSANAIILGFHVRVNPGVNDLAKKEHVEIRLYSIIYELLEDIDDAMAGRLEPEKREKELATVRILKIFHLSNGSDICGCIVEKGTAKVGAKARVYRGKELLFNGEVRSLRHLKDDVREVRAGMECGIRLDNFADFAEGDSIQLYEIELKKQTL